MHRNAQLTSGARTGVGGEDRDAAALHRPPEKRRSNAAIPITIIVVLVGLALGAYTIFGPLLVGLFLLVSGVSLLSSRINPLSPHFYSSHKASWGAVGVVFLGAAILFWDAYYLWTSRIGSLLPHL